MHLDHRRFRARRGTALRALLPIVLLAALPAAASAQHAHHASAPAPADGAPGLLPGLGSHHHPITTASPLAQRFFDQGLSLAYAFNHAEAKRSFEAAIALDSSCAMCFWGVAYVLGPNINAPMDPAANAEAHAAATRAVALAARAGERERAYARAIALRYAPVAPSSRAPLDSAYARAMGEVARAFPEDADAATLYAEAMMDLTPWIYWTRERAPLPGTAALVGALERALRIDADNPGACHFFIHAIEAAFPERAVPCAERLAALMPAAGHIVHMPAHIYLRVGRYADAIRANEHAVHADETYIRDRRPGMGIYTVGYYPHNYHFLAFAAVLAGRSATAIEAARAASSSVPAEAALGSVDLQLVVAYQHLTLATFGRWDDVLRLPLPPAELRLASGLAHFARGMALASDGRLAAARQALDSIRAAGTSIPQPIGGVLGIAERALAAELAARRGAHDEAIAQLEAAMRIEDGFTYMEPPYWHQPVRHLLGAALLAAGRPREAETRFREDLERFPDNIWSLRGLERSLLAQERRAEAAEVRQRFERASRESDVRLASSRF